MDASRKQREPVAFKSLAELKRFIRPGVEFKTVSHANHADMVGLTRVVTTVQTVGFYSKIKDQPEHPFSTCNHGKGFYTDFGKAGNYIFDGTTIKVKDARKQDRGVIYELEFYDREQNMEETMMDRKMVNFIKEQYPPGTRIRLNSMEDPYAPILPGTEGEVDFVDDAGQLHMKWDNGRSLALIPGEDSFTVLPPKLTTLKLYMPLTADLYERNEYPAWSGSTNSKVSNDQIISSLGIGVVRFNGELEPPDVNDFDYEYRVDTDVISSVEVSGGQSDPDNPVTVRFVIQGRTYTVSNVYYPDGDSQLVWVKWHTPSEPCVITIAVSVSGGGTAQSTITCNIVDLDGNDPPNPVADDRNDRFRLASIPEKEQVTSASWGIWSPWWQENWEWVENWEKCWHTDRWVDDNNVVHRDRWYHWVDNGWWEDHGWWEFDYNGYSASLTASMRITPDSLSPTATAATMKSGYGIQEKVTARVTTTQSAAVTAAQNAVTYFPEFG